MKAAPDLPSRPDRVRVLRALNAARRMAHRPGAGSFRRAASRLLSLLEATVFGGAARRLAVYGSLAPGEANHHVLSGCPGEWRRGWVRGELHETGWGADAGFPGFVWRPGGPRVPVRVLHSRALPRHWGRIDAFEGPDYLRILVPVEGSEARTRVCNLYALRDPPGECGRRDPP